MRTEAEPLRARLELPAARAAVQEVERLDGARAELAGRPVALQPAEARVHQRLDRSDAVVEAGVVRELGADVAAVGAVQPDPVALEVDDDLPVGAHRAHLQAVLVAVRAEVTRRPGHGPDGPALVAQGDGIVE